MSDNYTPKHRADTKVRTEPRLQPIGSHLGEYVPEDRAHLRLGADAIDWLKEARNITARPPRGLWAVR